MRVVKSRSRQQYRVWSSCTVQIKVFPNYHFLIPGRLACREARKAVTVLTVITCKLPYSSKIPFTGSITLVQQRTRIDMLCQSWSFKFGPAGVSMVDEKISETERVTRSTVRIRR